MTTKKIGIAIIHDNGVAGQCGATEYTDAEIKKLGGIDALIASYASSGITVIDTITITK